MNTEATRNNIKTLYHCPVKCKQCEKQGHFKVVEISSKLFPVPKIEEVFVCYHCKNKRVEEHEAMQNDFKLDIKCHFKTQADLSRRIYLNNNNQVVFKDLHGTEIFAFESNDAYVDTVETLIVRAIDVIKDMTNKNVDNETLDYVAATQKLEEMAKTGELMLEIHDPTGFTRVFPRNVIKIVEIGLEEDNDVKYTKIE